MERLPKSYSDQERAYITKRLKEEAAACMGKFGIRRTTVDELVKRVKIPKGTFYLFYPSKELLEANEPNDPGIPKSPSVSEAGGGRHLQS